MRHLAALQIACQIDLGEALSSNPQERRLVILRLERAIERERQRGARKHWSYDLNRHIGLKQALDMLRTSPTERSSAPTSKRASLRGASKTRTAPAGAVQN